MRLGFHYHIPAVERNSGVCMPGYLGRFVDALAQRCEEVICFLHTGSAADSQLFDHRIESSNVKLVNIGLHASVPRRLMNARKHTTPIRVQREHLDFMLIRGPSPLLPHVAAACYPHVLTGLLLVGDYVDGVKALDQPAWRKKLIHAWSLWNSHQQLRVAKRSLTFVNSRQLYHRFAPQVSELMEVRTTTLKESDFYDAKDRCLTAPIRLMVCGRIDRNKGLPDVVRALHVLVGKGVDLRLDIVGWQEKDDATLTEVTDFVAKFDLGERVTFHGYKSTGPELFQFYREADIFVVASRVSEGFPRTIWEAMAHSVPVVATRVGSIPQLLEGTSVLVSPGSHEDIAAGIESLMHSSTLRKSCIERGSRLAKQNTLEIQTSLMVDRIHDYVSAHRKPPTIP